MLFIVYVRSARPRRAYPPRSLGAAALSYIYKVYYNAAFFASVMPTLRVSARFRPFRARLAAATSERADSNA